MEESKLKTAIKSWYERICLYYTSHKSTKVILVSFSIIVILLFSYYLFVSHPRNFPIGSVTTIHSGDSLQEISTRLKNEDVIRSIFVFRTAVIILGGERKIIAGDYLLDKKESSIHLAYRLIKGSFHLETMKITIPEGWNVFQIGNYLEKTLIHFNKQVFLKKASIEEGYLFPDTYFVSPTVTTDAIIQMMRSNFKQKISSVPEIASSTKSLKDIIIMASILEGEALPDDRRTVAGILWKRISIGMPLQVDSTFLYINGKNTYNLTQDDLKINSPYNTYVYKGLPPGPINNPGLNALKAVVTPIQTKYLYFLTDTEGKIYYARTFAEHIRNKELYLK